MSGVPVRWQQWLSTSTVEWVWPIMPALEVPVHSYLAKLVPILLGDGSDIHYPAVYPDAAECW